MTHESCGHETVRTGRRARQAALASAAIALALLPYQANAQDRSVTIVLSEEPSTLDPCHAPSNAIGRVSLGNILETLTRRDPQTGQLMPELATSWEQVDDRTWRFELREGVTFHDGTPFNAEAAKRSIDRSMNPNLTCEVRTKFFGEEPLDVRVVDDHTLEIQTEDPNPILPLLMAAHTMYAPSAPFDEHTREAVGTGPYRLVEWPAGQRIVLERNPEYWGEEPAADRAEFQWRSESSVRAAMVKQGEADLAPNIAAQDVSEDLGRSYPNSETSRLNLDLLTPPLDDARVRAAINYAIDREAMRGSILGEDVKLATQMILPQINGYSPNLTVWPYRPDLARALLADAAADGVPVDTEIEFVGRIGHFPNATEFHEAIALMLQDVGLNVRLQWYEAAQKNRMQVKPFDPDRPPQIIVDQHDNNMGDAVFTVPTRYHSEGSQSKVEDPLLDFLIDHASTQTGEERTQAWQRVADRVANGVIPDAMLFHMVGYAAVGPRIEYQPTLETNSAIRLSEITFR